MKFKITKSNLEILTKVLREKDCFEIELEPVIDTYTQAIYEQDLRNRAFKQGYELGFKEGYHEGSKYENKYRCTCGCGGNDCWNRHCTPDCWKFNSKV